MHRWGNDNQVSSLLIWCHKTLYIWRWKTQSNVLPFFLSSVTGGRSHHSKSVLYSTSAHWTVSSTLSPHCHFFTWDCHSSGSTGQPHPYGSALVSHHSFSTKDVRTSGCTSFLHPFGSLGLLFNPHSHQIHLSRLLPPKVLQCCLTRPSLWLHLGLHFSSHYLWWSPWLLPTLVLPWVFVQASCPFQHRILKFVLALYHSLDNNPHTCDVCVCISFYIDTLPFKFTPHNHDRTKD